MTPIDLNTGAPVGPSQLINSKGMNALHLVSGVGPLILRSMNVSTRQGFATTGGGEGAVYPLTDTDAMGRFSFRNRSSLVHVSATPWHAVPSLPAQFLCFLSWL